MQALLQAEEGHPLAQTTSLGSDRADHLVYLLSTLRVFCMACPESLVPHFPTLVVYLKADNDVGPNREVKIIKTMTEMLQMLLPLLRKGDREAVIEAEQDLERIVYRYVRLLFHDEHERSILFNDRSGWYEFLAR